MKTINVSETTLKKLAGKGKNYYSAYLFVLELRSLHKHPILIDFKSHKQQYYKSLRIGRIKFDRLLKAAISLDLARYENGNLILFSYTKEKQQFKARQRTKIRIEDLHQFFYYQTIKKNVTQQHKAVKYKSTVKNTERKCDLILPDAILPVNEAITLSVRSAAKIFDTSIASAFNMLRTLRSYGLTIKQNIVHITKEQFKIYLEKKKPNIRFDKQGQNYLYVKAQSVSIGTFPYPSAKGLPYYLNDNW